MGPPSGKLLLKNDLQASLFQACDSQHTEMQRKLCSTEEDKASMEGDFQASIYQNSLDSELRPPCLGEDLALRVSWQCVPCSFCGLKTHSCVIPEMPMWKQAVAVCHKLLIVILWLLRKVTFTWK